jgi:hypothetical protein
MTHGPHCCPAETGADLHLLRGNSHSDECFNESSKFSLIARQAPGIVNGSRSHRVCHFGLQGARSLFALHCGKKKLQG